MSVLLLAGCGSDQGTPIDQSPRPIAWVAAEAYEPVMRRQLPGVVQAVKRARLSFEVGGTVESIAVDIGDGFRSGDVLARLESETYELQVQRAEAALAEAEAVAAEADNDFRRQQQLAADGFTPQAALDQSRAALETARSRVGTAQASLALAAESLEDATMRAPYAGEVTGRLVEASQQVAPGQPVLTVQGIGDTLEVRVMVPETLIADLRGGSSHPIAFPAAPGLQANGRIIEIGTDAGEANTYPVTLLLDTAAGKPRPGMTAEVSFYAGIDSAASEFVKIPVTAFLSTGGDSTVAFVYDAETGTLSERAVDIADITGDSALVSRGLKPGERIASRGLAFLRDGQAVELYGSGPARSEQGDIGGTR